MKGWYSGMFLGLSKLILVSGLVVMAVGERWCGDLSFQKCEGRKIDAVAGWAIIQTTR